MREDDIMRELRAHRAKIAKRFDYDLRRMAEYYNAKAAELIGPNGEIRLAPKPKQATKRPAKRSPARRAKPAGRSRAMAKGRSRKAA